MARRGPAGTSACVPGSACGVEGTWHGLTQDEDVEVRVLQCVCVCVCCGVGACFTRGQRKTRHTTQVQESQRAFWMLSASTRLMSTAPTKMRRMAAYSSASGFEEDVEENLTGVSVGERGDRGAVRATGREDVSVSARVKGGRVGRLRCVCVCVCVCACIVYCVCVCVNAMCRDIGDMNVRGRMQERHAGRRRGASQGGEASAVEGAAVNRASRRRRIGRSGVCVCVCVCVCVRERKRD